MDNTPGKVELELICVIVNFGNASKIIRKAKKCGVSGGTVFLGTGTISCKILEIFELCEIRKEIVLLIAEKSIAYNALEEINKHFKLYKKNHGIAFTTSVSSLLGVCHNIYNEPKESRGEETTMHNAIFVVVDKGNAELVIDAATKAGSRGGTIINARGSGIHETQKVFSMDIEPEKEIVLILSEGQHTEKIVSSIRKELQIDEPGKGIIFIQEINKTYGLY